MRIPIVSDVSGTSPEQVKHGKTKDAAKQFESLLIAQMLKSMREGGSGWLGSGEDQAMDSAMAMAEEHFASALSAGGGFGLAASVQSGLEATVHPEKLQD